MLSLGICTGSMALHVSMVVEGRTLPAFVDFTAAFWTVTAISLRAAFVNTSLDPEAGTEMTR